MSMLLNHFVGFARDRSGVGYIEFAYGMPVFIALTMGGVELTNLALTHARVSYTASLIADGAARTRQRIDEIDILELVDAAKQSTGSLNLTTHGRVMITTVEDNIATPANTTDQKITWKRCKGAKTITGAENYGNEGEVKANAIGDAGRTIEATATSPIIFAQIIYEYQPVISDAFFGPQRLHYKSAFVIRDRSLQELQNGTNMPDADKARCSVFTA